MCRYTINTDTNTRTQPLNSCHCSDHYALAVSALKKCKAFTVSLTKRTQRFSDTVRWSDEHFVWSTLNCLDVHFKFINVSLQKRRWWRISFDLSVSVHMQTFQQVLINTVWFQSRSPSRSWQRPALSVGFLSTALVNLKSVHSGSSSIYMCACICVCHFISTLQCMH